MTTPNINPKITIASKTDVAEDDSIAKKASPQSTKEFRKILDKDDDKGGNDDEGDQIKKTPTETPTGEKTVAVDTTSAAAVVVSLFDLPKASTNVSTVVKTDPTIVAEAVTSPTDVNIFNLNKKHTKPLTNPHALGHHLVEANDQPTESPTTLYAKMNTKTTSIKPEEDLIPDEVIAEGGVDDIKALVDDIKALKDDKGTAKFATETSESTTKKPVLSTSFKVEEDEHPVTFKEEAKVVVNPPITQVNLDLSGVTTNAEVAKPNPVPAVLKEVVDKLVTGLQTLSLDGKSETTIVLNDPSRPGWMFNGVQIVVTEFDTATGQLNIAFENLTQQAQNFLAARSVQASLIMTLEQQGYVVQSITPTPIIEHPILVDQTESGEKGRSGRQQQGQGNPQQQQKHTA